MKFRISEHNPTLEALLRSRNDHPLETEEIPYVFLEHQGIPGDRHYGYLKKAGGRDKWLHKRGALIANHRQWSAISVEELSAVARDMALPQLKPGWIGANLLFRGIPDFTSIPPLSRICIGPEAVLVVYGENEPCDLPMPWIEQGSGSKAAVPFSRAARQRRGLVGWIERPGLISTGDTARVYLPC
jgi:hypothetical protein